MREKSKSNKLYIFQWPSNYGGADIRLVHTLPLLATFMDITVVPNYDHQLNETAWTKYLDRLGIKYSKFNYLPNKLEGYSLCFSNGNFFNLKIAERAKEKGLYIIFSNDMMTFHRGELEGIKNRAVDCALFTSKFEEERLLAEYNKNNPELETHIVDNYINPACFPYIERPKKENIIVGRLSRASLDKYSDDFPLFYENLEVNNPIYKVMAWDQQLKNKYKWFKFNEKWRFFNANEIEPKELLSSLDLFVYRLGSFEESWCRVVVEAMLTGCVPIVQNTPPFPNLVENGKTGFLCSTHEEFRESAELLNNYDKRREIGFNAQETAREMMNKDRHISKWKEIFNQE